MNILLAYGLGLSFAFLSFFFEINWLSQSGFFLAQAFLRLFQCLSLPVLFFSLLTAMSQMDQKIKTVSRNTLFYTFFTTILSACVSMILYLLIEPKPLAEHLQQNLTNDHKGTTKFFDFLLQVIPNNILTPFLEHQVMGVLFLSLAFGASISQLSSKEQKKQIILFIQGIHQMLLHLVQKIIGFMPLAFFGFATEAIHQTLGKNEVSFFSLGGYFSVIIGANLIQGIVVLPLILLFHKIHPLDFFQKMIPALSLAFFSKSSTGTLPLTIKTVEPQIKNKALAHWILPLCTTINMNGCAAFIWTTCIYFMDIQGHPMSFGTMILWVFIATLAAVGNAGIPMGCFSLSLSLLTAMEVPVTLLVSFVFPIYSLIDMVETALNVWSDCCITKIVDQKTKGDLIL